MVALDVIRLSDEMVKDVNELSQVKTRLDNHWKYSVSKHIIMNNTL